MTIQGEKENCQIKYKGGAITVLGTVFNSVSAMPGESQDLLYSLHSSSCMCQIATSQIIVVRSRPPLQAPLKYAVQSYTSKALKQIKGRKNLRICIFPVPSEDRLRIHGKGMLDTALHFCTGQYSQAVFKGLVEIHQCKDQVNKKQILGFLFSCVADVLADLSQTVM